MYGFRDLRQLVIVGTGIGQVYNGATCTFTHLGSLASRCVLITVRYQKPESRDTIP